HDMEIDVKSLAITIEDAGLRGQEELVRSNGALLSVLDLPGAQVVVSLKTWSWQVLTDDSGPFENFRMSPFDISRAKVGVRPITVELDVPGHHYTLTPPALDVRVVGERIFLHARFPTTWNDMAGLERECMLFDDGVRRCRAPRSPLPPPPLPPNFFPTEAPNNLPPATLKPE